MATNGPEDCGEASSRHSRPRSETSRLREDRADSSTQPAPPTEPPPPSLQAFKCWQDNVTDSEVEEFVYEPERPSSPGPQLFSPRDEDCGAWPSPSGPKCPASFGDQGTTATAGAFGQLVQLSTYLGAGNSGMFSAGHEYTALPYSVVERAKQLLSLASESFEDAQRETHDDVFGLKFRNLEPSLPGYVTPRLKWFQHRWPRYEYQEEYFRDMKNVQLTIQFVVRDKTVYQQCIFENQGKTDVTLELAFCKKMVIDDLDHVTDNYEFNKTSSTPQNAGPGPGGLSWVHVNRFYNGSPGVQTGPQHSSPEGSLHSNTFTRNRGTTNLGVAVVVSVAVRGKMRRFCPGLSPHTWREALRATSKLEIVTAYKLGLHANPSYDWRELVIPIKEMDVNRFLEEAKGVLLFRNPITRMSRKDGLDSEHNRRKSKPMEPEDNYPEVENVAHDGMEAVESRPQSKPLPADEHLSMASPIMDRIEFTVRRNVQHILDICAIPVTVRQSGHDPDNSIWKKLRGVQAIALSCGDLSGHRICTTSSFFAFQFLADVAKRLSHLPQPDRDDTQVQALFYRIKEVCLGHLKWLYAAKKNDRKKAFGSLYWVSAEPVTLPESSDSWAPNDHPRDTAFQILKAKEFGNSFTDDESDRSSLVSQLICQWGRGWVQWLESGDLRESLVWWHKEEQGLDVFRFDDQVWIWKALKALEDEDDGVHHRNKDSSAGSQALGAHRMARERRIVTSWAVQREALLKFTMNHEVLGKTMLALTRSPRETRFLFHARDTALFYAKDMEFFSEDAAARQALSNTVDAQRLHENNQEARWDNALRYALSIMLGTRGLQINDRKPEHLVRVATELLLRSSSENGLFPGKLDIMAKSPLDGVFHREQDADSCYEASFEIPYIFLTHSEVIETMTFSKPFHRGPGVENLSANATFSSDPSLPSPSSHKSNASRYTSDAQQVQISQREETYLPELVTKSSDNRKLKVPPILPNLTSSSDSTRTEEISGDTRLTLKKAMPFSNIIDSHNIVEIEDEWLFNYPEFFDSKWHSSISIDDTLDSVASSDATWVKSIDVARMRRKYSSYHNKDGRAGDKSTVSIHGSSLSSSYSDSSVSSGTSIEWGDPRDSGLRVMDIASRKRLQARKGIREWYRETLGSFGCIWEQMRRPRTATEAKKRLIVCDCPGTDLELEAALLCYSASKGDEMANILEFFERHFRHENFIFDHCDLLHNTWDTEVHLSFFTLRDASRSLSSDVPLNFERFPEVRGKKIFRGSMAMRFHGDVFDRYWTLHLFSNVNLRELEDKRGPDLSAHSMNDETLQSTQRKVIELVLFDTILFHIETRTQIILAEVKFEMGIKSGAFSWSIPSLDTYSSWHRTWEGFAPLLQALANDLVSAQDIVGQWETREKDRGQERPRWTRNEEKKYRASITKGQRMMEWRKKGIRDALRDVKSLQEACTTRLANAREELQFRSNQNIASFTYVTIVFLPLGFAASIFGMNGYPDAGWVASMTVIAVVALTITTIALANAKQLLGVAEQLSKDATKFTRNVFQSSLIGQQQQRRREERVQGSPEPKEPSNGDPGAGELQNGHKMRHVLFWMAYLLIELPARGVALACRELPASLWQTLGPPRPAAKSDGPVHSTDTPSPAPSASTYRKSIRIAGGILLLPLLLVSWTIQLVFYNVLDVLVLLGRLITRTFHALITFSDGKGSTSNTKMLTWLIDPPSSLRPMRNVMSGDQKHEEPSEQVDTVVASDRGGTGPNEEV